ncbi:hypothetical protein [Shewanella sp. UCD-KL12]|uniref:hypothetical protein n=1 Tax=Shewanella sp. UCD-KL12 TaxID=1917163 RepID=UPI000970C229|nr:hypothetical protein [Shewanella sp. UCD-KL12]
MGYVIKRIKACLAIVIAALLVLPITANAGKIVVRKSSEPFDAFAVRDQVLREHEWQEALRMQQQIQILQALPIGCILVPRPYAYYSCQGAFYRPYQYQNQDVYIRVDAVGEQSELNDE